MALRFVFWFLMLVMLILWIVDNWPLRILPSLWFVFLYVLIGILGWKVFGKPIDS